MQYARTGAPPPGLARPQATPITPADAVQRLAGHHAPPISQGLSTQPFPAPPQLDDLSRTFEQVYLESTARPRGLAPPPRAQGAGAVPRQSPVFVSLHSFLRAPPHAGPRPPPPQMAAPPPLSVPEQVQIRDRSTILARHLFADRGDAAAAAHADSLLASLGISAAELPPRVGRFADNDAWHQVWQQQQQQHAPPEPSAMQQQHVSQYRPAPAAAATGGAWADAFAAHHHTAPPPPAAPAAWAEEFASRASAATVATGDTWAGEFRDARVDTANGAPNAAMVQQSKTLAGVLARDPERRFKDSQFLQFLSKMSEGGSEFVSAAAAPPAQQWAAEFAGGSGAAWADTFAAQQRANGAAGPAAAAAEAWAQDFAAQQQQQQTQQQQRGAPAIDSSVADAWAEDFAMQQVWRPACLNTPVLQPRTLTHL